MCNFPNIQYNPDFARLRNQKIPLGTYTYLKNNRIVDDHLLDGIPDMEKLEECINEKIKSYNGNDDESLYDIFCLIQIWGGNFGKRVFVENQNFESRWNGVIKDKYRELVNVCTGIKVNRNSVLGICEDDVDIIYNAIWGILNAREGKNKVVPGFGVAFITKHTRFWLQKNNFNNPLPIFDSVMSWGLFKRQNADITHLRHYWECMIKKAESLKNGMTLLALERQLFNYFPTIDERKKEKTQEKKCRIIDLPTPPLYQIESRHDVLEEEEVMFGGITTLLIIGRTPGGNHFCGFWNKNGSIDSILEISVITNDPLFSSLHWQSETTHSRKYVMYRKKDSYGKAKELKDKISEFIHNMSK